MMAWPNAVSAWVAADWNFRGPCLAPRCGLHDGLIAALQGADLIRRGRCDLVLAGAGDASLDPLVLGAFRRMGILARVDAGGSATRAVPCGRGTSVVPGSSWVREQRCSSWSATTGPRPRRHSVR